MSSPPSKHPTHPETPAVFWVSAGLVLLFVAAGVIAPGRLNEWFGSLLTGITRYFGWFYLLAVGGFVGAAAWLGLGPYRHVRLGQDDERPEFGTLTWFAMLFSAGMGIGLVFFGVAEPIQHFGSPPEATPGTVEAAQQAMTITYFHWGIHAWCIYVVTAASLAYFSFRRGLPLAIRSALYPLFGERIHGPLGQAVDIVAVFGTLFGLATSLGLGAGQINAGLQTVFGLAYGPNQQMVIIVAVTLMATASVVTGLHAGVRRLSEANMVFAVMLLMFVFLAGETSKLLDAYIDNLGAYITILIPRTFHRNAFRGDVDWHASWTLFYWGWWVAWAPFVGTFIARISRGRTLQEFVLAVSLVPTLVTFFWLTVFGDSALILEMGGVHISEAVEANPSTAIYHLLDHLPLSSLSSVLTVIVVVLFFVTSSDSGSLVVDMLTSGGDPDPPIGRRIFWALTEGAVAAVLLRAGGLEPLQAAAIATGLPFCVVLVGAVAGMILDLRRFESG